MKRLLCPLVALLTLPGPAPAYIDRPPTLGRLIRYDASDIAVFRVEKVSKEKGVIIYEKVADLKGKYPTEQIRQAIDPRLADPLGPRGLPTPPRRTLTPRMGRAWQGGRRLPRRQQQDHRDLRGPILVHGHGRKDGVWKVNEFEERALSWAYVGSVGKLRRHVTAILVGKEVVLTAARYDREGGGPRELWDNQTAYRNLNRDDKLRIWRIRAPWTLAA